ncbi:MAG: hypothetical protein AAGJ82_13175 [Bacteroidota bacterium]
MGLHAEAWRYGTPYRYSRQPPFAALSWSRGLPIASPLLSAAY